MVRRWYFQVVLWGWLIAASSACVAAQLAFSAQKTSEQIAYEYRWQPNDGSPRSLAFALSKQALSSLPHQQHNYSPALAQRYVYVQMMKAAKAIDPKQARVTLSQQQDAIKIAVRSPSQARNQAISDQLREVQQAAFDEYLHDHYYTRYTTVYNQQAVKPDHIRFIREYQEPLIPLSQAIYDNIASQSDAREYFDFLLSWVQSIPYDTLEDRSQTNGAGFLPPAGLLAHNQGDCDSKSVLTAAIARGFLPDTPMILILLPQHALLGVALTPRQGDDTVEVDGTSYILYEPTGPARLPFGQIAPDSRAAIANRHYTVEKI